MDVTLTQAGVKITVLDGPYLEDGRPTAHAIREIDDLISRLDELKGVAADRLLALYNEAWADDEDDEDGEGCGPLDRSGFVARIGTASILLFDELGAAVVLFDDGDLFGGHTIEVDVDEGVPTDARISG